MPHLFTSKLHIFINVFSSSNIYRYLLPLKTLLVGTYRKSCRMPRGQNGALTIGKPNSGDNLITKLKVQP